ncbi:MAG: hypothetical protein FNNCIFGK_00006 [Bacteroidia bacterium]|nr:hypothetical protein [Bacteroidia bacterium]
MAGHFFADFDFFLNAIGYFFQVEFYFNTKVGSTIYSSATCTLTSSTSKKTFEWIMSAKNISKLTEDVFHVHVAATAISATIHSLMTKLVISAFLFCITQYLIRFSSFFKFFFSFFIARIFIRMVFDCHLPVSLFYFCFCSVARYSKYFVIISLCHFCEYFYPPTTTLA